MKNKGGHSAQKNFPSSYIPRPILPGKGSLTAKIADCNAAFHCGDFYKPTHRSRPQFTHNQRPLLNTAGRQKRQWEPSNYLWSRPGVCSATQVRPAKTSLVKQPPAWLCQHAPLLTFFQIPGFTNLKSVFVHRRTGQSGQLGSSCSHAHPNAPFPPGRHMAEGILDYF